MKEGRELSNKLAQDMALAKIKLEEYAVFFSNRLPVGNQETESIDPSRIVVLFDGHCNFCKAQVEHLRRFDGKNRLQLVSLHNPIVKTNYPDLSFDQLMEQMWVVSPDGRRFGGADGIRYLSRVLPMLWPLTPLMHIPGSMPLWRCLYRQVAKRRYKIAGRSCDEGGTCSLHK